MSATRKNARRLKALRRLGMPIGGDYRLREPWAGLERGALIEPAEQKLLLAALAGARPA